ncbi:MAG: polyprenyl synthetase family protein, partial [Leptonema sp. (in: Bacteria)]|nr:polyprenyl synthetase family protein [Leptonema sp. (in: bacteria)]
NQSIDHFSGFGIGLGLLFQITDDLLDVEGNSALTGKATGKDSDLGKLTFPSLLGLTESRRLAESLSSLLKSKTKQMPLSNGSKKSLSQLVDYVLYRDH